MRFRRVARRASPSVDPGTDPRAFASLPATTLATGAQPLYLRLELAAPGEPGDGP